MLQSALLTGPDTNTSITRQPADAPTGRGDAIAVRRRSGQDTCRIAIRPSRPRIACGWPNDPGDLFPYFQVVTFVDLLERSRTFGSCRYFDTCPSQFLDSFMVASEATNLSQASAPPSSAQTGDSLRLQDERRRGARGLAGSITKENDLPVSWNLLAASSQGLKRNSHRSWYERRSFGEPAIDIHDK
jgi:hypothetical protein